MTSIRLLFMGQLTGVIDSECDRLLPAAVLLESGFTAHRGSRSRRGAQSSAGEWQSS